VRPCLILVGSKALKARSWNGPSRNSPNPRYQHELRQRGLRRPEKNSRTPVYITPSTSSHTTPDCHERKALLRSRHLSPLITLTGSDGDGRPSSRFRVLQSKPQGASRPQPPHRLRGIPGLAAAQGAVPGSFPRGGLRPVAARSAHRRQLQGFVSAMNLHFAYYLTAKSVVGAERCVSLQPVPFPLFLVLDEHGNCQLKKLRVRSWFSSKLLHVPLSTATAMQFRFVSWGYLFRAGGSSIWYFILLLYLKRKCF
jgi:hypothetical protein